jgi:hypothetical protein
LSCTTPDTVPVVSCAKAGSCHNSKAATSNPQYAIAALNPGKRVIVTTPSAAKLCEIRSKKNGRSNGPRTITPPRGCEQYSTPKIDKLIRFEIMWPANNHGQGFLQKDSKPKIGSNPRIN